MSKKYELVKDLTVEHEGRTLYRIRALRDIPSEHGLVSADDLGGYIACENNLSQEGGCWITGDAMVYGSAEVTDNARVTSDAVVYGHAVLRGSAKVKDAAKVYDNAVVTGGAYVGGASEVFGNAWLGGNARVMRGSRVSGASCVENARICGSTVEGAAAIYGPGELTGAIVRGDFHLECCGAVIRRCGALQPVIQTINDWMTFGNVGSEYGVLTVYRGDADTILCTRGCFVGSTDEFLKAVKHEHGESPIAQEYALMIQVAMSRLNRQSSVAQEEW